LTFNKKSSKFLGFNRTTQKKGATMVDKIVDLASQKVQYNFAHYAAGLIASNKKKSCVEIARTFSISHDKVNRILKADDATIAFIKDELIDLARTHSSLKSGNLILDDTLISKIYAKLIEGIDYNFNSATGKSEMSLCAVVLAWSNANVTIPLNFEFCFSKDIAGERYQTKIVIAKSLILDLIGKIDFDCIVMDGLYASEDMMLSLIDGNLKFSMRMPNNRIIDLGNGTKVKLREVKALKLNRNERSKSVKLFWRGIPLYITAELRIDKNGERSVVYIASNWEAPSKLYIATYKSRWPIEMVFRTSKQSLGLQECSARQLRKQRAHVFAVFKAYTFLQIEIYRRELPNVESLIKHLQNYKPHYIAQSLAAMGQFFTGTA